MKDSSFKIASTIFGVGASIKLLAVATAIGMLAVGSPAHASRSCTSAPQNQWLSMQELQTKVETLGYKVQKAKLEKRCAEFYILDQDGNRIELYVDPTNGQIVDQRNKGAQKTLTDSTQAKNLVRPCTSAPENQWLSMQELLAKVETLGYKVQNAALANGCATLLTLDQNGNKAELLIDPSNGQIVDQLSKGSGK